LADESEVRFMHQRSGLERLARPRVGQSLGSQLAEFIINQRHQLCRGLRIAGVDLREDGG
jgi:hypothetical protein